jgi:deoxyribodipyrimidine photo-lyase
VAPVVIWWARRDLRLGDNPALSAAAAAGEVVAAFVIDPALWEPAGGPRRAFLAGALGALDRDCGGRLVVRRGHPGTELLRLVEETGAAAVYAAADFGPYGRRRDHQVAAALGDRAELRLVGSPYAVEPGTVRTQSGGPYRVFTPFSRAWLAHGWERPLPRPARISWVDGVVGVGLPDAPGMKPSWPEPGEAAALARLEAFLRDDADDYATDRDDPGADRTSRLSAHLKWGCVHPRTLLARLDARRAGHRAWRTELCWREFYADVLWEHPESARRSLQPQLAGIRVDSGPVADQRFAAWCQGRTGYPIVDAGMRQLQSEGWMHNRVRMIVASFLVKDLHLDWTRGARWFLDRLVDGDLASNNHGWQWVAGTGTDAAPYYRVFNPVAQGRRFDPAGVYVRRWVPEVRSLPDRYVHCPWEAPERPLGLDDYPDPIVDHAAERAEALARYAEVRGVAPSRRSLIEP